VTGPAPIVPNFMMLLPLAGEVKENHAISGLTGPHGATASPINDGG